MINLDYILGEDFSKIDAKDLRPLTPEEHEKISKAIERDETLGDKINFAFSKVDKYFANMSGVEVGYIPHHIIHEYILRKIINNSEHLPLPDNQDIQQDTVTNRYAIERTDRGHIISYEEEDKNKTKFLEIDMVNEVYTRTQYKYVLDTEFTELVNDEDNTLALMQAEIDDLRNQLATAKAQVNATNNIRDILSREAQRSKKALEEANKAIEELANSFQEQQEEIAEQVEEQQAKAAEELQNMIDELSQKIEDNDGDISELEAELAELRGKIGDNNDGIARGLDAIRDTLSNLDLKSESTKTRDVETTGEDPNATPGPGTSNRVTTTEYDIAGKKVKFDVTGPRPDDSKLKSTEGLTKRTLDSIASLVLNKSEIESLTIKRGKIKSDRDFYTDEKIEYQKQFSKYKPSAWSYNTNRMSQLVTALDDLLIRVDRKLKLAVDVNPNDVDQLDTNTKDEVAAGLGEGNFNRSTTDELGGGTGGPGGSGTGGGPGSGTGGGSSTGGSGTGGPGGGFEGDGRGNNNNTRFVDPGGGGTSGGSTRTGTNRRRGRGGIDTTQSGTGTRTSFI